jgi:2-keto-4-pentenoate hydratase/2-oxohepta-3-ene-1,7-dioic acid hydratase in catechol pathway
MTNWSLLTVRVGDADVAAVRLEDGTLVVPDALAPYAGLRAALDDWATVEPLLRDLDPAGLPALTGATSAPTVRYPHKMLGVGANYYDHVAEMGAPRPPDGAPPFYWTVPTRSTFIGDGEEILIPADPEAKPDWEAEVAVVIGKGGKDISEADAYSHVAGYAAFSDITARGYMKRATPLAPAFLWDWFMCKGLDTFKPMGAITPAWQVPDPGSLSIRCLINGVVKQDGSTKELISGIPRLISFASQFWTLEPGDVIATGTPTGVGHPKGEHLADGDEVRVEVTGLAPLVNPVRQLSGSAS